MSEAKNLTPEKKTELDALTIRELLSVQRFAPIGDPRFMGAEGKYRMRRLSELRAKNPEEYVLASKSIG